MFTIYGLGFASIFLLYTLLYHHAFAKRNELELNVIEQHDTMTHVFQFSSNVAVGLVSVAMAWLVPDRKVGYAGFVYFLLGVVATAVGMIRGTARRRVEAQMLNDAKAATSTQTIQPT